MKIVKKSMVFLAVATAMVSLASIANAVPSYFAALQIKYPNTTNITCGVCHTTQFPVSPDVALNPYGLAFQARPHTTQATVDTALNFIERLDSDGDGYTNLTELTANTLTIKVLPGFATLNANFPAAEGFRAVPPKLLFFDNFSNAGPKVIPNWAMTGGLWAGAPFGGSRVLTSPLAAVDTLALINQPNPLPFLTNFRAGTIEVQAQLVTGDQADIVFAWTAAAFRAVGISANEITIGQDGTAAKTIFPNAVFADLQPHLIRIVIGPQTLTGSVVTVFVDGTRIGARKFAALKTGRVGLRTKSTTARFDNMKVSR